MNYVAILVLLVASCAAKTSPVPTVAPSRPADPVPAIVPPKPADLVSVVVPAAPTDGVFEVRVNVARRGGEPILPNSVVPTGSDFEIGIELDESAYVYVGGISAADKPYLVIPAPTEPAQIPAGRHRLPARSTTWFVLQPPSGKERMFVIASRRPLAEVDRMLAQTVGELPMKPSSAPPAESKSVPVKSGPTSIRASRPVRAQIKSAVQPPPPRARPTFTPELNRTIAMNPRGQLVPRTIGIKDYGPQTISARDGLVIYILSFTHVPSSQDVIHRQGAP